MSKQHVCPKCNKTFETLYEVYGDPNQPFVVDGLDAMRGLEAFATYDTPKQIICHQDGYLHIQFADGEERLILTKELNMQKIDTIQTHYRSLKKTCEHVENDTPCTEDATPWFLQSLDTEPVGYYCDKHAADFGFCISCGAFCAGFEHYDFSPIEGYCGNCVEHLRAEMGEYDDDEYDEYEYDDYEDGLE